MKKVLLMLFFVVGSIPIFAQQKVNNPEKELLKVYSQSELDEMKLNKPKNFQALVSHLNDAMEVRKANFGDKKVDFETISLDEDNLPSFTELGVKIKEDSQYFFIKGSDKVLYVRSFYHLIHNLN